MNMSTITHLRSVAISAEDPAALLSFYEDTWGLHRVGTATDGSILLRANGDEHHVLALSPGTGHSLELISLGAESPAGVDDLAARLREQGAEIVSGPGPRTEPGGGYAVVFLD